jgi:putative SOS response-associated peptidase YedK
MPMAFAGLWECWHDPGTERELETFTIVTTTPNELVAPIHNRMPVILAPEDYARWLDPEQEGPTELLAPYPVDLLTAYPVSTWVNSPTHDDLRCIEPVSLSA